MLKYWFVNKSSNLTRKFLIESVYPKKSRNDQKSQWISKQKFAFWREIFQFICEPKCLQTRRFTKTGPYSLLYSRLVLLIGKCRGGPSTWRCSRRGPYKVENQVWGEKLSSRERSLDRSKVATRLQCLLLHKSEAKAQGSVSKPFKTWSTFSLHTRRKNHRFGTPRPQKFLTQRYVW